MGLAGTQSFILSDKGKGFQILFYTQPNRHSNWRTEPGFSRTPRARCRDPRTQTLGASIELPQVICREGSCRSPAGLEREHASGATGLGVGGRAQQARHPCGCVLMPLGPFSHHATPTSICAGHPEPRASASTRQAPQAGLGRGQELPHPDPSHRRGAPNCSEGPQGQRCSRHLPCSREAPSSFRVDHASTPPWVGRTEMVPVAGKLRSLEHGPPPRQQV